MKGLKIKKSIEVFFVIILILGLCVSAAVLMDSGRKSYSRILENNSQLDNARTALSYLGMRIHQNDTVGSVNFLENAIDGSDAILLKHTGDEQGLVTYIYFNNGELKEIYTWDYAEPDPENSETIAVLSRLDIEYKDNGQYLKITAYYEEDGIPRHMVKVVGILSN